MTKHAIIAKDWCHSNASYERLTTNTEKIGKIHETESYVQKKKQLVAENTKIF